MSTPELQQGSRPGGRVTWCKAVGLCTRIVVLCGISLVCHHAHAEEKPPTVRNLDGLHVTVGPVAVASRAENRWDAAFGIEVGLFRVSEGSRLLALGATSGAQWFSERPGGRGWVQLEAATRLLGLSIGASAGPSFEVSEHQHLRLGGQATLWIYAAVMPMIRVGASQESGPFIELGVRIAFPTVRF